MGNNKYNFCISIIYCSLYIFFSKLNTIIKSFNIQIDYLLYTRNKLQHIALRNRSISIIVPFSLNKIKFLVFFAEVNCIYSSIYRTIRYILNEISKRFLGQMS